MPRSIACTLLVVGGGPGGYVTALRASQLGLNVVLVEAGDLGGTCLNSGCIPSKALLHASERFDAMCDAANGGVPGLRCQAPSVDMRELLSWKAGIVSKLRGGVASLLSARKVEIVRGWAVFENAKTCTVSGEGEPVTIRAENVVLATGSVAADLPGITPGGNILTSTEALTLEEIPESLVTIGAGYIGLELSTVFARLGAEVTVIEAGAGILPQFPRTLSKPVADWFAHRGVVCEFLSLVESVVDDGRGCDVIVRGPDGAVRQHRADKVLVAVGRRPNTDGWGLGTMGVDMAGPFVAVNGRCETSMRGVWAIGDLVGEPMLAHKATAQGEMVAEIIAGRRRTFEPLAIASVCFTEPEVVSVGMSAEAAESAGIETLTGRFPLAANGRVLSMGASDGYVEIVARKPDNVVVGLHAVGTHISELAGEFALAIEMQASLDDIAATIHAHPTLGEGIVEAALNGLGTPLHII